MFDRNVEVDDAIPAMILQLMSREQVDVPGTGISIIWNAVDRHIDVDNHRITLEPPALVKLTKIGITLSTPLRAFEVSNEGRTINIVLDGPDVTLHLIPHTAGLFAERVAAKAIQLLEDGWLPPTSTKADGASNA